MTKVIKILLVAVVLFSAAAAGSWFLQQKLRADSDTAKHTNEGPDKSGRAGAGTGSLSTSGTAEAKSPKGAIRPPFVPESERVSQMASSLQQQLESLKGREQQLATRQKNLELIHHDIRNTQQSLDEVRKTISEELKLLGDKMGSLENKASETRQQGVSVDQKIRELKKGFVELTQVEKTQADRIAKMADGMDSEATANTLREWAEKGKIDMAVKVLSSMKDRQAAQVLTKLSSSNGPVASQLLERLMALKNTAPKTP
jgi:flagellar motility protein MotE (MotC chaperone)